MPWLLLPLTGPFRGHFRSSDQESPSRRSFRRDVLGTVAMSLLCCVTASSARFKCAGVWRCELCRKGFRSPQAVASHKKHVHPGMAVHGQKELNLAAASHGPTPSGPPVSLAPGGPAACPDTEVETSAPGTPIQAWQPAMRLIWHPLWHQRKSKKAFRSRVRPTVTKKRDALEMLGQAKKRGQRNAQQWVADEVGVNRSMVCRWAKKQDAVTLGCCCLCCEEAPCAACWFQGRSCSGHLLHGETAMMKGTVMFASLLKRDSGGHAPNIEPKLMSTFPQNETLAVACWDTPVMWDFRVDPRPLIAY